MAGDYEDVSVFILSECTFMWVNGAGEPVGVIMNYVWHNDRFWVTATRRRARVGAVERNPNVAIAISSRGTDIGISQSITYKGRAVVHDDAATKEWFYPALAKFVRPDAESQQIAFAQHLDSPGRVVIEIVPTKRIGFDAEAMFKGSAAGSSRTRV
jgi:general stress protein 26